jgi:hypothetical protein
MVNVSSNRDVFLLVKTQIRLSHTRLKNGNTYKKLLGRAPKGRAFATRFWVSSLRAATQRAQTKAQSLTQSVLQ